VYEPGTLPKPAHVGCLDVAILRGQVDGVVGYQFGNRCEHSVRVDFGAARVVGIDGTGRRIALVAYDPAREIGPRDLDARASGEAWIEYDAPIPFELHFLQVDVGEVVADESPTARITQLRLR
jgi:hypothetical protein